MKKHSLLQISLLLAAFCLLLQPALHAQKLSRKALRAILSEQTKIAKREMHRKSSTAIPEITRPSLPKTGALPHSSKKQEASLPHKKQKRVSAADFSVIDRTLRKMIYAKQNKPLTKKYFQAQVLRILEDHPNLLKAFKVAKQLQDFYPEESVFSLFAASYYSQHFVTLPLHLREFFKKADSLHNNDLEVKILKRLRFLGENKNNFRLAFDPNTPKSGMRVRYLENIANLTPGKFSSEDLVFSFERKMAPTHPNAIIGHISAKSMFPVGKEYYPVYQYNGPVEYLVLLYRYVLTGNRHREPITVVFDAQEKAMAIYNKDHSRWLRITPHEYNNPSSMHIHLNETRTAEITTTLGLPMEETVHFNLYIPLAAPKHLPLTNRRDYLYQLMVLDPLKHLKGTPGVKIVERSIF